MRQQSSTQDLNESKASQQSMERYLQIDSNKHSMSPLQRIQESQTTRHYGSSILKLQNGRFSNDIFKEALNKKKSELHKRNKSQTQETPKERKHYEMPKKQQDKVKKNIEQVKTNASKKPAVKPEPLYIQKRKEEEEINLKKKPVDEESDKVFLETVERLYSFDKRRKQQLDKAILESKEKEKVVERSFINQRSCLLLDKKFKQLIDEEEEYKQLYQFKEKAVQVDLIQSLPKLKDYLLKNKYGCNHSGEPQQIEIIVEKKTQEEKQAEGADDQQGQLQGQEAGVQYNAKQSHQKIQTEEIKFTISDTIKKLQEQQGGAQVSQFQEQQTPQKKKNAGKGEKSAVNQRQKRQEIMEKQGQRVKTECQYYVPLQERYHKVLQQKEEWLKSQQEKKKHEEEERLKSEILNKSQEREPIDPEEFQKQQMSWLEKRNESILQLQIKKDNQLLSQLTFNPKISNKKTQTAKKPQVKVEDRLLEYQQKRQENLQKLENKYLPTFQPNLQTKQLILSQHLSQTMSSKSLLNASFNNTHNLWQ